METYDALRSFAGSWGLLLGIVAFACLVLWVFRPGARKAHDEAARQIFRNEDAPPADRPDTHSSKQAGSGKDQGDGH
ncbi:CcoQ/FixQ family Cbb3-type cytochrome c oxidase assembly chaperone [Amaricoccus sp.]|uniref:cbb3-type cytochrome c oxidase subunit 3 n=1 Tax=Amaricoccus sp. TaxID=1872485 RepID=UPI00262BA077|nr:CcoQ/FixQ family Cbb3-type cytochrome c oxidase assembly chaperone [Amaricoccus sp.]HRO12027.1 CcoQ/FixQ family Cbb3-type cytochrome c oxidase assembly chaperone [Amaricoccus sp.]